MSLALAMACLRIFYADALGPRMLFALSYPGPLLAAALGGFVPALLTSAVTVVVANVLFYPDALLVPRATVDRLQLFAFLVFSLGGGWLVERERRATARARALADDARRAEQSLRQENEERRRTEEELRASSALIRDVERRLRVALDAAQMGTWLWDVRADSVVWDESMVRLFGLPMDTPTVGPSAQVIAGVYRPDRDRIAREFASVSDSTFTGTEHEVEYRVRRRDGDIRWITSKARIQRAPDGSPLSMAGACIDVTERKALQEQLLHSQKMEGIGRLAGGVAHDFNNLLTGILGFADLADMSPEVSGETRAYLQQIRQAGDHAARLTRQLLAFARKQVMAPQIEDLNQVLIELHQFLRRLLDAPIELVTLPSPDLWAVMVDRSQIEQTVINLAVNARDALRGRGQLTLRTQNVVVGEPGPAVPAQVPPGEYVALVVSDTGCGMADAVRRKAFDPFFTTKPPGEGTGLGLSMCHGIVSQHGGHIWVESEPGQGASFTILLPRARPQPPVAPPVVDAVAGGHEVVLLAEDERLVRTLAVSALERSGYVVLQAASGTEALDVARRHQGPIHLLLTDVVMPHLNGVQLADAIAIERPDTRVLFTSGYSENAVSVDGILRPGVAFLPKPYTPVTLGRAVRRVLDGDSLATGATPEGPPALPADLDVPTA